MHWLRKIEALKTGDPCEFHYPARSQWIPGIVVYNGGAHYWEVRDESDTENRRGAIATGLYIENIRCPGQTEAWPGRRPSTPDYLNDNWDGACHECGSMQCGCR